MHESRKLFASFRPCEVQISSEQIKAYKIKALNLKISLQYIKRGQPVSSHSFSEEVMKIVYL